MSNARKINENDPKRWSGTKTNLAALKTATKDLKAENFNAKKVQEAYSNKVVAAKKDLPEKHFVEVVDNSGADYSAALKVVFGSNMIEYLIASACVSPHVSERTLSEPSEWARYQRVRVVGDDEEIEEVHWMDIVSTIPQIEGLLIPFRTCNWYLSILTAGIIGHFIKVQVISEGGDVRESGLATLNEWVAAINNPSAKTFATKKVARVITWIRGNRTAVVADMKKVKEIVVKARWSTV